MADRHDNASNVASATPWPTDAYESISLLVRLYLTANSLPYREWKPPTDQVRAELEDAAQMAVRGLQTRLYIWLLERRIGVQEAEIAREKLLMLLTRVSNGTDVDIGNVTRLLLEMIDDAFKTAEELEKNTGRKQDGANELPEEYFMALYLLMRLPESPYDISSQEKAMSQDAWTIMRCLIHGKDEGIKFFTPMVDAVTNFNIEKFPEWSWRKMPGAHERHLQRRFNNPLFPVVRRKVSSMDVLEARRKDDAEYRELLEKVKAVEIPDALPADWNTFLNNIREHLDALIERALQIGGDTSKVKKYLTETRDNMINVWRQCVKNNPETLQALEKAEAFHKEQREAFRGNFINQMLRKDGCIPGDEMIPALLCEDAASVIECWAILDEPARQNIRDGTAKIVSDAVKVGYDINSINEVLSAMGIMSS